MRRIDVHQHLIPPAYANWLRSTGVRDAGGRELPSWSVDDALELMDGHAIATAILSVSTPGVHLAPGRGRDPVARARAREVDWPFAPSIAVNYFTGQLGAYSPLDDAGHRAIDRGNAEALFPRFAQEERP